MRLLIRYLNGLRQEAILLAAMENRIRIAAPGQDDAMEFRFVEGHWLSEALEPVEIDECPEFDEVGWSAGPDQELAALHAIGYAFGIASTPDQFASHAVN